MENLGPWDQNSREEKLTLLIARSLVGVCSPEAVGELLSSKHLDWVKFNRIIAYHEIFPSAHIFLKKYTQLVPAEELRLLERNFYSNLLQLTLLNQEALKMLRCLQDRNITALPLKGAYFLLDALVYADKAYLRPMCDIDILVKKEDYPQARSILESQGYKKELRGAKEEYWHKKNYHLAFTKQIQPGRCAIIEIHWALDYSRNVTLLPQLWKRIRSIKLGQRELALLSAEDSIFSLALHQRRFGKMLLLKSASDLGLLLIKNEGLLDWDYLLAEANRGKMRTTLYFVLAQAEILFNIKIAPVVLKALDISKHKKALIRNLILKNSFIGGLELNKLYLKVHFLLYDDFREPVQSILNIPQEQFAKFYKLSPYSFKTSLFYHFRWLYFIKEFLVILFKGFFLNKRVS